MKMFKQIKLQGILGPSTEEQKSKGILLIGDPIPKKDSVLVMGISESPVTLCKNTHVLAPILLSPLIPVSDSKDLRWNQAFVLF